MKKYYWSMMLVLSLVACTQRDGLAPVVESKWREANVHLSTHTVRRGETLYAIAFRYEKDYRQLAAINQLRMPYTLKVGQVLQLTSASKPSSLRTTRPSIPFASTWSRRRPTERHTRSGTWVLPAAGRLVTRYNPQQGKKGINIAGRKGEKIRAAAAGVVAYAGSGLLGYGNLIIIKHDNQYLTAYGNNLMNQVHEGQHVSAGQVIAEMGVVEHRYWGLHFEIRKAGRPVNPLDYVFIHPTLK